MARACIIGAGAASLSAARTLINLGVNCVLFEQAVHIGGKCKTILRDGQYHDAGAVFVLPNYPHVRRLARDAGNGEILFEGFHHLKEDGSLKRYGVSSISVLSKALEYKRLAQQLLLHNQILRKPIGAVPENSLNSDLALPFGEFAAKYQLSFFMDTVYPLLRSFGFGYEHQNIPAAYILNVLPKFAPSGNFLKLWAPDKLPLARLEKGYAGLWEKMGNSPKVTIHTATNVTRVHRSPQRIDIEYEDVASGARRKESFDHLVIGAPLPSVLHLLSPSLSAEHVALIKQIRSFPVWHAAVHIEGQMPIRDHLIIDRNQDAQNFGRSMILLRYSKDSGWFYVFGYDVEKRSNEALQTSIEEDFAQLGCTVSQVLVTRWPHYFPHFSSENIRSGAHQKLEALQGDLSTFYVGEIFANIGVESVCDYSATHLRKVFSAAKNRKY